MSAFEKLPPEKQRRLDEAAAWWHRIQKEPAAELSREFLGWVSDPINGQALKAVESTMAALDDFGATPNILDMRRSALTRLRNAGTVRWLPRKWTYAAAAAVLLLIGGGAFYYSQLDRPISYRTDVGERRVVALPDGSRISLDSNSAVDVRYSKAARAIVLEKGRARFDVAHDVSRPFTVAAGNETVVAVGTSFDVERRGASVLVTLIQGHVIIKHSVATIASVTSMKPKPPVSLSAGEQMVAVRDEAPKIATADLEVSQAWEVGHLVFRGEPLADAVEQVNRYTDRPIVVDPSAASIRISGVFNTGDIGSFVSAITGYFPVEATTDGNNVITLQKRS